MVDCTRTKKNTVKVLKSIPFILIILLVFMGCDSDDDNDEVLNGEVYTAALTSLNDSGASGTATVLLDLTGETLEVNIQATGLVPNQPHPQHIHGTEDASVNGTCPPAEADTDDDGIITVPEGAPFYGGILLPLEDFPMTDADGNINFSKTFILGEDEVPTALTLDLWKIG